MPDTNTTGIENAKIAVIGLGYVGLPLAVEFAKKFPTVGFDINEGRVAELNQGHDRTLEVEDENLSAMLVSGPLEKGLYCSNKLSDIEGCNYYIVTVPTPVDKNNRPDLTPVYKASETVGKVLKRGDTVIYESTVYPGVTEEECVPVLERVSGLKFNEDFFAGYSPERINPGDKEHTVAKILKITWELNGTTDCDSVILAVSHDEFRTLELSKLCKEKAVIYDVKGVLPKELSDARL